MINDLEHQTTVKLKFKASLTLGSKTVYNNSIAYRLYDNLGNVSYVSHKDIIFETECVINPIFESHKEFFPFKQFEKIIFEGERVFNDPEYEVINLEEENNRLKIEIFELKQKIDLLIK